MFTKDHQWSRQAFLVSDADYPEAEKYLRSFNSADVQYHDTTMGGNTVINPLPQFTRYADPPIKGMYSQTSTGMGGTYTEAFNDNQQVLHLRFGVAKYNSMVTFFTGFYNYKAAVVARTGRVPGFFYSIGAPAAAAALGATVSWVFPLFMLAGAGISLLGYGARFYLHRPSSKYYYLKPTMTTYWAVASIILNYLIVNMGYLSQPSDPSDTKLKASDNSGLTPQERAYMHDHMPELFKEDGFVDALALASRGQRMARLQEKAMTEMLTAAIPESEKTWFGSAFVSNFNTLMGPNALTGVNKSNISLKNYIEKWRATSEGRVDPNMTVEKDTRIAQVTRDSNNNIVGDVKTGDIDVSIFDGVMNATGDFVKAVGDDAKAAAASVALTPEFAQAELDDGTAFVSFRVDYTGSVSESWTNGTTDSELKGTMNSMSSSNRNSIFTTAGRELTNLPLIGGLLGFGADAVKDIAGSVADATGLSGLMALGGSAFVDIPKHWQDSSYSGPRMNYTVTLDALYNHPFARVANQFLPLSLLLAGVIPLGAGKQSYTSPFLCEAYDRGRAVSRLAIMRDMTVTRGQGNTGFLHDGTSLTFEVSFSIEDLSSVMAMPVQASFSPNIVAGIFDDDNNFSDYMSVLTNMGLTDMIYPSNKVARNWKRTKLNARKYLSPAYWGSIFANKTPARMFSVFYRGIDKK